MPVEPVLPLHNGQEEHCGCRRGRGHEKETAEGDREGMNFLVDDKASGGTVTKEKRCANSR